MDILSDEQIQSLRHLYRLTEEAENDLADSLETGLMSDSKSSVYAVRMAADALILPAELKTQLQQMARDAWHGASSAGGIDVYSRAGHAMGGIGDLQRFLKPLLESGT